MNSNDAPHSQTIVGPPVGSGSPALTTVRLNPWLQTRLSALWFFEQFAIGAWIVTAGTYMVTKFAASGTEISLVYLSMSIGAILASAFVGFLADRVFSPRTTFIVLHAGAAAAMFFASSTTSLTLFLGICVTYMVLYMPTQPLATSMALSLLDNPEKQFPLIRVWGTVGWIVGGLIIGWLGWEQQHMLEWTFILSGLASAVIALGSMFLLPKVRVERSSHERQSIGSALGLDALKLLKGKSYRVFFIASLLISIPVAFFNNFTNLWLNEAGVQGAAGIQTLAQISEAASFLLLPFILARFGVKKIMLIAMIAWIARFAFFSFSDTGTSYWMIILGLMIHGVCYDFFFVTGQIYTDRHAPKSLKNSAQALIFTATYGVGMLIGSLASGPVVDFFSVAGAHNWQFIWLVPCAIAALTLVYFLSAFRDSRQPVDGAAITTTTK